MRNRVFRCIENRARGFVGILFGEMVVGFALFAVALLLGHPLIGLAIGGSGVAGLAAWRKKDHDREDYARIAWRRIRPRGGAYSTAVTGPTKPS